MKPYYQTKNGKLFLGDSKTIVSSLPPSDLVFTSPPYEFQRNYELPKEYDFQDYDYTETLAETFLNMKTKSKTQIIVNFGLIYRNHAFIPYWQDFLEYLLENKYRLYGLYIWDQCEGLPGHFKGRFSKSYEFLFHFNKERIDINKTVMCRTAGRFHPKGSGGLLMKNGDRKSRKKAGVTGKYKIPRDIIRVPRDKGHRTGHPAVFPVGLPKEFILAMTKQRQVVLDPFMGTGSTAIACEHLNRKWLGVEVSEKYCEIAAKRIEKEKIFLDSRINEGVASGSL